MSDREVLALKRQRTLNKNKLLKIIDFAWAANETTTLEQLSMRLEQVEKLHETLCNIETQIAGISETEEADIAIEDSYYEAGALLKSNIRNNHLGEPQINNALSFTMNAAHVGHQAEVKLPKLYIPPFLGEYADWPFFFDMFCTTIHDSNLSGVEKFQYLKGLLRGEAASLLKHFRVTESSYIGAFNKLKERYNNSKYIIHSYIKTFMEQPTVQCNSLTSLRKLRDVSDEVLRGLAALGDNAEARDPWVIYLMLKKVDEKTEIAWANYSNETEHPSIAEFFKFLDKRISALETCSTPQKRILRSSVRGHFATNNQQSISNDHRQNTSINSKCAMCSNESHFLLQCDKFHDMNAVQRKEFIQTTNRCYNCLGSKHPVSQCLSKRRCQQCGRKHHTLLHFDKPKVQSHSTVNIETETTEMQVSSLFQTNNFTNSVSWRIKSGWSNSLLQSFTGFGLPMSGIGDTRVGATKGKVKLVLKVNKIDYEINALVLQKITCSLPVYDISRENIRLPKNFELADPDFHISREIDILIGADHFFSCLEAGQMKLHNSPLVLQKTIFGWIVSGQMDKSTHQKYYSMTVTEDVGEIIDVDQSLRQFWEIEEVTSLKPQLSEEEAICEIAISDLAEIQSLKGRTASS